MNLRNRTQKRQPQTVSKTNEQTWLDSVLRRYHANPEGTIASLEQEWQERKTWVRQLGLCNEEMEGALAGVDRRAKRLEARLKAAVRAETVRESKIKALAQPMERTDTDEFMGRLSDLGVDVETTTRICYIEIGGRYNLATAIANLDRLITEATGNIPELLRMNRGMLGLSADAIRTLIGKKNGRGSNKETAVVSDTQIESMQVEWVPKNMDNPAATRKQIETWLGELNISYPVRDALMEGIAKGNVQTGTVIRNIEIIHREMNDAAAERLLIENDWHVLCMPTETLLANIYPATDNEDRVMQTASPVEAKPVANAKLKTEIKPNNGKPPSTTEKLRTDTKLQTDASTQEEVSQSTNEAMHPTQFGNEELPAQVSEVAKATDQYGLPGWMPEKTGSTEEKTTAIDRWLTEIGLPDNVRNRLIERIRDPTSSITADGVITNMNIIRTAWGIKDKRAFILQDPKRLWVSKKNLTDAINHPKATPTVITPIQQEHKPITLAEVEALLEKIKVVTGAKEVLLAAIRDDTTGKTLNTVFVNLQLMEKWLGDWETRQILEHDTLIATINPYEMATRLDIDHKRVNGRLRVLNLTETDVVANQSDQSETKTTGTPVIQSAQPAAVQEVRDSIGVNGHDFTIKVVAKPRTESATQDKSATGGTPKERPADTQPTMEKPVKGLLVEPLAQLQKHPPAIEDMPQERLSEKEERTLPSWVPGFTGNANMDKTEITRWLQELGIGFPVRQKLAEDIRNGTTTPERVIRNISIIQRLPVITKRMFIDADPSVLSMDETTLRGRIASATGNGKSKKPVNLAEPRALPEPDALVKEIREPSQKDTPETIRSRPDIPGGLPERVLKKTGNMETDIATIREWLQEVGVATEKINDILEDIRANRITASRVMGNITSIRTSGWEIDKRRFVLEHPELLGKHNKILRSTMSELVTHDKAAKDETPKEKPEETAPVMNIPNDNPEKRSQFITIVREIELAPGIQQTVLDILETMNVSRLRGTTIRRRLERLKGIKEPSQTELEGILTGKME